MQSGDSELFEHGRAIHYLYDAQGVKLRKEVYGENGYLTEVLDYDGPVVYRDGAPDYILTGEGRLVFREEKEPVYEYFLADHLGNTRVTFRVEGDSVSMVQENHYYPFGLSMAGLDYSGLPEEDATQNPYLYNGKVFQGDEGLGWYDYGARFYDAQVGRWWSVDPKAEKYSAWSPYAYCLDNSFIYIDPDGRNIWLYLKEVSAKGGVGVNAGAYYQWGTANDDYGTTYFKASGAQVTDATAGNLVIGGDIDLIEGGIGWDWKDKSFGGFVDRVKYLTVSGGPIDLSFDNGFVMVSGGLSAGIAFGRVYASYSLSKGEYKTLMQKTGSDLNIDHFEIRNEKITYDDDGNIVNRTGNLFIKNYNGEKYIDLGIQMQAGSDNMWKSMDYIQTQKEDR